MAGGARVAICCGTQKHAWQGGCEGRQGTVYQAAASRGWHKYSSSICSNSRVRKMKLPGVISFRNDLPICHVPSSKNDVQHATCNTHHANATHTMQRALIPETSCGCRGAAKYSRVLKGTRGGPSDGHRRPARANGACRMLRRTRGYSTQGCCRTDRCAATRSPGLCLSVAGGVATCTLPSPL